MSDELELDQEDFAARLGADSFFADKPVLVQRKGVTEQDIETALSTLNEKGGKIGMCVAVLMPSLIPEEANSAPTPLYSVRLGIQVIESPVFNLGETGTGHSAEESAARVRQLGHLFTTGRRGSSQPFVFAGMEPVPVDEGKVSYAVFFKRKAGDVHLVKVAPVTLAVSSATVPSDVTLTCASAEEIYYTTDGSYPSPLNEEARLYVAPIALTEACTVRAVGHTAGKQQSDCRETTLT